LRYSKREFNSKLISKTKKIKKKIMLDNTKIAISSFKKDIKFFLYTFFSKNREIVKNIIDIVIEYIK
jgi:hypothetical protein